jgi:hypothetical protein
MCGLSADTNGLAPRLGCMGATLSVCGNEVGGVAQLVRAAES